MNYIIPICQSGSEILLFCTRKMIKQNKNKKKSAESRRNLACMQRDYFLKSMKVPKIFASYEVYGLFC